MLAPRMTETQKAAVATFQTRINSLRPMQIDALDGRKVGEYNILAEALMIDMTAAGVGGQSLSYVVDGKLSNHK